MASGWMTRTSVCVKPQDLFGRMKAHCCHRPLVCRQEIDRRCRQGPGSARHCRVEDRSYRFSCVRLTAPEKLAKMERTRNWVSPSQIGDLYLSYRRGRGGGERRAGDLVVVCRHEHICSGAISQKNSRSKPGTADLLSTEVGFLNLLELCADHLTLKLTSNEMDRLANQPDVLAGPLRWVR